LITVEEYKNKYKPIDDFDPSVSSDLEEIKKMTRQMKTNKSKLFKDSITYGRHIQKLKQTFDASESPNKPDSCVYIFVDSSYLTLKFGRKSKTRTNEMSYKNLQEFFGESDENNYSLSINKLKTFFPHFRIQATLLNNQSQIIYESTLKKMEKNATKKFLIIILEQSSPMVTFTIFQTNLTK
jgi:hypothetical protein